MKNRLKKSFKNVLLASILPIIIILLWELSVRWELVPTSLVASPSQVIAKFYTMLVDGRLWINSYASMKRLLIGFFLGTSLGIAIGTVVGFWKLGAKVIEPTFLALLPIPPIAWIPFVIILFGIGEASKIALISMGSFWTLFLQTSYGIRTTDKNLIEVALILKKDWKTILRRIMLPACLPHIFSGMRVALAISWGLLVASEIIASSKGIGWLIWDARNFSRPSDLIVGMIAAGILGKLTDGIIIKAEKRFTNWRTTYQEIN